MTLFDTLRRSRFARISLTRCEPTEATAVRPAAAPEPPPAAPPEGAPRLRDWIGVLAMGTGLFMAIMDVQIVTSSLTQIQGGLSASADEIAWVQTAYLIADVVMVPMSGMMSRLLSTRVLFVIAALAFAYTPYFVRLTRGEVLKELHKTNLKTSIIGQPIRYTTHGDRVGAGFFVFQITKKGPVTIR